MDKDVTFRYRYSAKENKEIQEIRQRYLPQSESAWEELKRLDRLVQSSGIAQSLCTGIGGALVFGLGLCLAMQVLGTSVFLTVLGVLLGLIGTVGILLAYPVHQRIFVKTKQKYTPRIRELLAELFDPKEK